MTDVTWNPAGDDDTSFGPLTAHNVLGGRTAADAHPAAAVSYDNDVSGLTGDTVQEAIDELATSGGAVDSVNGETGVVVLDAGDVGAVPNDAVGLLPGETNRGTWDVAATYAVGDVVVETGANLYVATAPSTGDQPSLTPGSWDVLDPTGRRIHLGPAATSGDGGLSVGYAATSGAGGLSVGPGATSGDFGLSVGTAATSGDGGLSVGTFATAGDYGTSVGYATAGDYGVNIANIYKGTLDPGDPTTPTGATIATGFVDLPETADATNPPADHQRLIARTDGLYVRDQTGTEVGLLGAAHAASHQDGGSDELALDGSQITTGTVAAARLGSGSAAASTFLRGDQTWAAADPAKSISYASTTKKWVMPGVVIANATTFAHVADTAYYEPWVLLGPLTIDALGVSISAGAAAGKLLRMAVFAAGERWSASGAPVATTAAVAADVAANTKVIGSFSPVTLTPGLYVAAIISDGTPTVNALRGSPVTGVFRSGDGLNPNISYLYDGVGGRNWTGAGFPSSPAVTTGLWTTSGLRFSIDCREV